MTVKYWEIREDRKIVALVDFWSIKAGGVGGTVGADVTLPPDTFPMWVGEGANVRIVDEDGSEHLVPKASLHLSRAPVW